MPPHCPLFPLQAKVRDGAGRERVAHGQYHMLVESLETPVSSATAHSVSPVLSCNLVSDCKRLPYHWVLSAGRLSKAAAIILSIVIGVCSNISLICLVKFVLILIIMTSTSPGAEVDVGLLVLASVILM